MSVKIRLKKLGRRHRPFFRVCAMDTRTRRDGREIEILGTYDPMVPETDARAVLNGERIDYWLGVGAQASPKVSTLIKKYGTNGSHLDAQKAALEKLGGRRAASITAAVSEAEKTKLKEPSEEAAPAEETTATDAVTAEAQPADAEATTESAGAETADGGNADGGTAEGAEATAADSSDDSDKSGEEPKTEE